MSVRTGPSGSIYADTTIPGTSAVAMTAFKVAGNSVDLITTTTTGGCVSLTFTAEVSVDGGTTYADYIDRDSVWSMVVTTPTTAGTYRFPLEGLALVPGDYCRLSYTANTALGKLQVSYINWENPKGGGVAVSVGDVVVDVDAISVNIEAVEQTHGDDVGPDGFMQVMEAKAIDGTALPNNVAEGKVTRPAATLYGGTIATVTNKTGQYELQTLDDPARRGYVQVTDGTTDAAVIATIESLKTDTSSVAGTVTDVDAGNASAGSQRVVIATDDVNMAAINASLTSVIGTDGAAGPASTVSIGGTNSADGKIQEIHVDAAGDLQVDVLTLPGGLTGYAEDTTHANGDIGIEVLTKRTDTAATSATADGKYATLNTDASGRVWSHDPVAEALLTTIDADTGAIKTATELIDDSIYADDGAWTNDTSKHTLVGGIYQSTPQTVSDGKTAPVSLDVNGMVRANIGGQSLTAVKVSATAAANTATNPIFSELTDGGAVISTSNPLSVNLTDGTSASLISDADTARATTDHVLSVQEIGADGTVAPTGSLNTNAPFAKLTDGTTDVAVIAATTALKTDVSSIAGTATTANRGGATAGTQRVVEALDRTVTNATGAAAINTTTAISADFDLKSVTIHLSAALAAGETVYITLDANDDPGAQEYDAVLREYDLGTAGKTSFTYTPAVPIPCENGDEIKVTMANSLSRTYGLRIVTDAR